MLPRKASDKLKQAISDLVHDKAVALYLYRRLCLNNNNTSAEGAKALAEALKVNTALQRLYLYNNTIYISRRRKGVGEGAEGQYGSTEVKSLQQYNISRRRKGVGGGAEGQYGSRAVGSSSEH